MRPECEGCLVLRSPLFSSLTSDQISRMACVFRPNRYHRSQILFFEGGTAQQVFALRSGLVKIGKLLENGKERIVRVIFPGELFGLEALSQATYPLTAITVRDCEICAAARPELFDFLRQDPEIALDMVRFLVGEVARVQMQITEMSFRDARMKLASFLLSLVSADSNAPTQSCSMTLPFSRQEISEILELSPETVSRTLSSFRRERLIDTCGRQLAIRDLPRLEGTARR